MFILQPTTLLKDIINKSHHALETDTEIAMDLRKAVCNKIIQLLKEHTELPPGLLEKAAAHIRGLETTYSSGWNYEGFAKRLTQKLVKPLSYRSEWPGDIKKELLRKFAPEVGKYIRELSPPKVNLDFTTDMNWCGKFGDEGSCVLNGLSYYPVHYKNNYIFAMRLWNTANTKGIGRLFMAEGYEDTDKTQTPFFFVFNGYGGNRDTKGHAYVLAAFLRQYLDEVWTVTKRNPGSFYSGTEDKPQINNRGQAFAPYLNGDGHAYIVAPATVKIAGKALKILLPEKYNPRAIINGKMTHDDMHLAKCCGRFYRLTDTFKMSGNLILECPRCLQICEGCNKKVNELREVNGTFLCPDCIARLPKCTACRVALSHETSLKTRLFSMELGDEVIVTASAPYCTEHFVSMGEICPKCNHHWKQLLTKEQCLFCYLKEHGEKYRKEYTANPKPAAYYGWAREIHPA